MPERRSLKKLRGLRQEGYRSTDCYTRMVPFYKIPVDREFILFLDGNLNEEPAPNCQINLLAEEALAKQGKKHRDGKALRSVGADVVSPTYECVRQSQDIEDH